MSIKNDKFSLILITIIGLGFATWFGGSLSRTALGYDLFYPDGYLTLRNELSKEVQMHTVNLYSSLSLYTSIGYSFAFASAIALSVRLRKKMKEQGWLFMAFVLFFVASPVQFYLIYFDWQLAEKVLRANVSSFTDINIEKYFLNRFRDASIATFSALSFLLNLTCVLYVVWQPLSRKETR